MMPLRSRHFCFPGIPDLKQTHIHRHDVAQTQMDDVARYQFTYCRIAPVAIVFHIGLDRQSGLQCGNGVARLVFFPEFDHGVGLQRGQNDEKSGQWCATSGRITVTSIIPGMDLQK